jgi:hypothetical protein
MMLTKERIKQFLTGEATGDSTDYTTPVMEVGEERHQFYFELEGRRLLMQINCDGVVFGWMALDREAVCELANVFSAARDAMEVKR